VIDKIWYQIATSQLREEMKRPGVIDTDPVRDDLLQSARTIIGAHSSSESR
jgi:hypothetical protein